MANSRLTESWQRQRRSLTSKETGNTEWVSRSVLPRNLLPDLCSTEPLKGDIGRTNEAAADWAKLRAGDVVREISARLVAEHDRHVAELREGARRSQSPEAFPLSPLVADELAYVPSDKLETPMMVTDPRLTLPRSTAALIRTDTSSILAGAERLSEAIAQRRASRSLFELLDELITQLEEMVATFFKSVQIYRSAVLAMNARALAERAGIGQAIDALEQQEVPDEKKEEWAARLVDEIFGDRQKIALDTDASFDALEARLRLLSSKSRGSMDVNTRGSTRDARVLVEEEFRASNVGSSQRSVQFWSVSMANKSSIVSDLHGWRTPSVSGEELQAPGKSGPQ